MLSFNPITGQLDFVNPAVDISGKLNLTGGTMTGQLILQNASATGAVNVSPTWNNAGTDFVGIYGRVTNTSSGASSKLIDVALADGSRGFVVTKAGNIQLTGTNAYRNASIDVPGAAYGSFSIAVNGTVKLNITTGGIISNGVPIGSDWGGYLILRDSGSSVTELSIKRGAGSPEGVVTANPGSIYLNSSGGPPYYKNTGTGNTGWVYSGTFILGTSQVYMHALGSGELVLNGQNDADPLYKLVLGATQATTGTTVTLKAGDVTTGTGSDLSIEAGVGSVSDGVVNIGRTTNSRVGFFYANSSAQIDTWGSSASHIAGTGSPVNEDDTFDGYTLAKVVAALRAYGLLA